MNALKFIGISCSALSFVLAVFNQMVLWEAINAAVLIYWAFQDEED